MLEQLKSLDAKHPWLKFAAAGGAVGLFVLLRRQRGSAPAGVVVAPAPGGALPGPGGGGPVPSPGGGGSLDGLLAGLESSLARSQAQQAASFAQFAGSLQSAAARQNAQISDLSAQVSGLSASADRGRAQQQYAVQTAAAVGTRLGLGALFGLGSLFGGGSGGGSGTSSGYAPVTLAQWHDGNTNAGYDSVTVTPANDFETGIINAKADYAAAESRGDSSGMLAAHARADALRTQAQRAGSSLAGWAVSGDRPH